MTMMSDQIKVDRCYQMTATNGRKVVVRVESFSKTEVRITEHVGRSSESFSLRSKNVRFFWRYVSSPKWSPRASMPLARFAMFAEAQVACDAP